MLHNDIMKDSQNLHTDTTIKAPPNRFLHGN
jgi:hypothetical protein